ncbi:hypothetical protein SGLAD_v1c03690 [Spiroplasma gladiatoris]|uniref:Uncharacterized protein n=1 Tax=Spiroplasma gladiatoris TaxID=2143 RepID=A0A4P7AIJ1_9MOLU|nr:hypothetical protein [Spiroplasma gladiatoris]QBQ07568.1 hypothetical protein SGLAD_v1c03690 [Spiroplasma gladiatoris]
MCCKCSKNIFNNCSCSIYEVNCTNSCCWCCSFDKFEFDNLKFNYFNEILIELEKVLSNHKHLKIVKKVLKQSLQDLNSLKKEFKVISEKNYLKIIDNASDIKIACIEIETDLGYKIRNILKQWEIQIEIIYLIINFEEEYFSKKVYVSLSKYILFIYKYMYSFANLFKLISNTPENISLIETIKEKFIDLDNSIKDLDYKLKLKI